MKNIIGLDIGGTKINGVLWDGKRVIKNHVEFTAKTLPGFKAQIKNILEKLSNGEKVVGLGVGQPGVLNPKTGKSAGAGNIKFLADFNSLKFYKGLGINKVAVTNDAQSFALAESVFGQGKKYKNFVAITLGTGIGGGVIINHELYLGNHNAAGHLGHMRADGKDSFEAQYKKYRDSVQFIQLGELIGRLISGVMNLLDVEAFILGGSVAEIQGKKFLSSALQTAKPLIVNSSVMPKVLISQLKNAGAIGAAMLIKVPRSKAARY